MLEIHSIPTATPYTYSASYRARVSNILASAVSIANVVLFDEEGEIEPGRIGTRYIAQISTTYISSNPIQGYIVINGVAYNIVKAILCKNPAFKSYWECELKTTKTL